MKIILSSDDDKGISSIQDWLHFNDIQYQWRCFWDVENQQYSLPQDIEQSIVVCDYAVLQNFMQIESRRGPQLENLKTFCGRGNQLWVMGVELAHGIIFNTWGQFLRSLDTDIAKASIVLFLDAVPTDRCWLNHLENIQIRLLTTNHFNRAAPRCQSPTSAKTHCRYDYLLTMLGRSERPHREVLWQEFNQRPGLLDKGLVSVRNAAQKSTQWIGRPSYQHTWHAGHASMDLYLDCWLEIVPETCYRDLYFFTEKTYKPIMTCTPFLMVSTAGYLAWMRDQGFRTFHSLIDEGYDQHYRIQDRVTHMTNVLEDIIHNGTQDFYHASQDILDHNFARLCEIAGSWQWHIDQILWQTLEDFRSA